MQGTGDTQHTTTTSARLHAALCAATPAEPMNKQEKKKEIMEQSNLINGALAECFYTLLFLCKDI